jgi:predicted anti-sigma-YlaC factor YlaD
MSCDEVERQLASGEGRWTDAALREHLGSCAACRGLLSGAALLAWGTTREASPAEGCPREERLLAWLDGSLDEAERSALAGHAAGCDRCAERLASLTQDLDRLAAARPIAPPRELEERAFGLGQSPPSRARVRRQRWAAGLAAAAGFAAVAIGLGLLVREGGGLKVSGARDSVERGADTGALAPQEPRGAVAAAAGLTFRWTTPHAVDADGSGTTGSRCRVVVVGLDRVETVLQGVATGDSWTPAPEQLARLEPGVRYLWIVEPLQGVAVHPSEPAVFWLVP